jgi:hypothetical protein
MLSTLIFSSNCRCFMNYSNIVTFCEEKNLQLRNGAFLGEEQVIVLNRHRNRNKEEMA